MHILDNLRMLPACEGFAVLQHINCNFVEVTTSGVSTQSSTRKLTQNWSLRKLPNGEQVLRSWLMYFPSKSLLFCFYCRLFGTVIAPGNLILSWRTINPALGVLYSRKA